MNIYLVLDGSDSVGERNFTGAKNCLRDFIEKVTLLPPNVGTLSGSLLCQDQLPGIPSPPSHSVPETSRPSIPSTCSGFLTLNSDSPTNLRVTSQPLSLLLCLSLSQQCPDPLLPSGGELWSEAKIWSGDICHRHQHFDQSVPSREQRRGLGHREAQQNQLRRSEVQEGNGAGREVCFGVRGSEGSRCGMRPGWEAGEATL